ncbi:MAG: 3-phosphoshikimate 1-carboxyvinyltransferase, partial [Alphaproteobacteria bacterium]|nr:3-phosphoshikimate 1-carboxyvinyltransferase [Alphaproteobacteria bacterium]
MRKPHPLTSRKCGPLTGSARVPGDKSLSHRSLILGSLVIGETIISGLLESADVLDTAAAMQALGAHITRGDDGLWRVYGVGVGGLREPDSVLDLGNSGTSARLLLGLLASHPITAVLTGDASLRRRPMKRVMTPLRDMGATFMARGDGLLPLAVRGSADPLCIEYRLPVPSAQVKSAILLAALNTPGATTVIEPVPTRDHTENMLRHLGVQVDVEPLEEEGQSVTVTGFQKLQPSSIDIAADPSSAAFAAAAAALVEGS